MWCGCSGRCWSGSRTRSAGWFTSLRISQGGVTGTVVDHRLIVKRALELLATQLILVHNHPSGNPHPSDDDRRLTQLIQKGAQTMNIRMIDHVIITDGLYYSFNDEGML